jgi:hypothetical protein
VRSGYGVVLAEKVATSAPDRRIAPPSITSRANTLVCTAGCLICGVSEVPMAAAEAIRLGGEDAAAEDCWVGPISVDRRADRLVGWLCVQCATAYLAVGTWDRRRWSARWSSGWSRPGDSCRRPTCGPR